MKREFCEILSVEGKTVQDVLAEFVRSFVNTHRIDVVGGVRVIYRSKDADVPISPTSDVDDREDL